MEALCKKYLLPVKESFSAEELAKAAQSDKKTAGGGIHLVLLHSIGDSFTKKLPLEELRAFFEF